MKDLRISLKGYISQRQLSHDYVRMLWRTVEHLEEAGVTSLDVTDESVSAVNAWLKSIQHPTTRSNYKRAVVTLARLHRESDGANLASRILRVKSPVPPPVAYTQEEVQKLIATCREIPGVFKQSHCPKNLWATCLVGLLYGTGLRWADCYRMNRSSIRGTRLFIVQRKTGEAIHKTLEPGLTLAIAQLSAMSPDETLFLWAAKIKAARRALRTCWKKAGLPGTPKWLRRTGATAVEAAEPGSARRFLGHKSIGLAERHYIDQSLLPDRNPLPPPIFDLVSPEPDESASGL